MTVVKRSLIILGLITLLGGFLRFWHLGTMPPSLNWDEVSHGYNAYSILKTGRDEWGVFMPHIFRAFGDYKLPVYIYFTTFSVWLFGLTPFAVRFVSALAGTLAIPGIYLLTTKIVHSSKFLVPSSTNNQQPRTNNYELPSIAALLLAISPWHFFISRPALEANLALTFIIYGGYFLLRFFENTSSFLPAAILFSLSLHTYNTARVFVPLLIIASFIIFRRHRALPAGRQGVARQSIGIIILLLSFSLVFFQVLSGVGTARYEKLKILSEATVYQIGQARLNSNLSPILARFVHNRPVFFLTTFTKNYFNYFSPQFFFQSKGSQSQFAIPETNLLTIPVFLLAILGVLFLINSLRTKHLALTTNHSLFLLSWLLLSPIAAALTVDPPQALRPNPMIPALIIFATIAFSKLPKVFRYLSLVLVTVSFSLYSQNYFGVYRTNYSQSWQYGYYLPMDFIRFYKGDYSKFFVTKRMGEPHIFYAFYNQLDPKKIQPGGDNVRFQKSDWFWTDKIENVYFVNDWDIPKTSVNSLELESGAIIPTHNSILITSPDHIPVNASIVETIKFLDGTPAFIISYLP